MTKIEGTVRERIRAGWQDRHEDYVYKLRSTAVRLMSRVPHWWQGTTEAYFACVRCNFADVLE